MEKYLNKVISDNIPHTSSKIIPESCMLFSLDVVSLFTNIPLDLTINSQR